MNKPQWRRDEMGYTAMNRVNGTHDEFSLDLDALLHPAQAFEHPDQVVNDPDLSLNEKRAILASWASDACAVEAAPSLRCAPGGHRPVPIDAILDALRSLDPMEREGDNSRGWLRRRFRRTSFGRRPAFDSSQDRTVSRCGRADQGARLQNRPPETGLIA
jgi:hypothetical protein